MTEQDQDSWKAGAAAERQRLANASADELLVLNPKLLSAVRVLIEGCLNGNGYRAISTWDSMRGTR